VCKFLLDCRRFRLHAWGDHDPQSHRCRCDGGRALGNACAGIRSIFQWPDSRLLEWRRRTPFTRMVQKTRNRTWIAFERPPRLAASIIPAHRRDLAVTAGICRSAPLRLGRKQLRSKSLSLTTSLAVLASSIRAHTVAPRQKHAIRHWQPVRAGPADEKRQSRPKTQRHHVNLRTASPCG
jgi:hypothetical protein